MHVHVPVDHRLAGRREIEFRELEGETFILYPRMVETHTRELQQSVLEQAGISATIYEGDCSPFFYDLLVPVGKGIRFWNWTDRLAPNTVSLTIRDEGYETQLYMLYQKDSVNPTVKHFTEEFLRFREDRR